MECFICFQAITAPFALMGGNGSTCGHVYCETCADHVIGERGRCAVCNTGCSGKTRLYFRERESLDDKPGDDTDLLTDYLGECSEQGMSGDMSVVTYLVYKGCDLNLALKKAAAGGFVDSGSFDVINYLVDQGADDFNGALRNNFDDVIMAQFLVEKGADDFNGALRNAWNVGLAKFLVEKGADDFNGALMNYVASAGHLCTLDLIVYFIQNGADNFDQAMAVCSHERQDIMSLLIAVKMMRQATMQIRQLGVSSGLDLSGLLSNSAH
jgi:hypothetical protein